MVLHIPVSFMWSSLNQDMLALHCTSHLHVCICTHILFSYKDLLYVKVRCSSKGSIFFKHSIGDWAVHLWLGTIEQFGEKVSS